MANSEQLEILLRGASVWNKWRRRHPLEVPNLSGVEIKNMVFVKYDLSGVCFFNAIIEKCTFESCDFSKADLSYVCLHDVTFRKVTFDSACLCGIITSAVKFLQCEFNKADLQEATIVRNVVVDSQFRLANLSLSFIAESTFRISDFSSTLFYFATLHSVRIDWIIEDYKPSPEYFIPHWMEEFPQDKKWKFDQPPNNIYLVNTEVLLLTDEEKERLHWLLGKEPGLQTLRPSFDERGVLTRDWSYLEKILSSDPYPHNSNEFTTGKGIDLPKESPASLLGEDESDADESIDYISSEKSSPNLDWLIDFIEDDNDTGGGRYSTQCKRRRTNFQASTYRQR